MSLTELCKTEYDREIVNVILPKCKGQIIEFMVKGVSRKGAAQNLRKAMMKMSNNELRQKARWEFSMNLVDSLREERIWNLNKCSLLLYRSWEAMQAGDEQWQLLELVPWYHAPSEDKLKWDEIQSGVRKREEEEGSCRVPPAGQEVLKGGEKRSREQEPK